MMDFISKNGAWMGPIVLAILGVIAGLFIKKAPVIVQGDDPTKKKAEDVEKKADDQAVIDAKKKQQDVQDEHTHAIDVVVEDQKKDVVDDPGAVNDFIKKVGGDVLK